MTADQLAREFEEAKARGDFDRFHAIKARDYIRVVATSDLTVGQLTAANKEEINVLIVEEIYKRFP